MSAKPDEVTSSLAALRIAFSVRPLRGRVGTLQKYETFRPKFN